MKIKFPLKMADNAQVRTIEELRAHFDLASVLRYYDNGKLNDWLSDRYYEDEAEKVSALDSSSVNFKQQLCDIFGVPNSEDIDLSDISLKNRRLEHLKQFTADDAILAAIDYVAFTQEELAGLLDKDAQKVFLCGEHFNVLGDTEHVTFIGVNHPTVHILKNTDIAFDDDEWGRLMSEACDTDLTELIDIDYLKTKIIWNTTNFKGVMFDEHTLIVLAKESDPPEAIVWWARAAKSGNAEAQFALAKCYENGIGFNESLDDAVKWYRSSAEQGLPKAQYMLGDCYRYGDDDFGIEEDVERAVDWYRKAAKQGMAEALIALSEMYEHGDGVEQSDEEAYKLLLQAAEQGGREAQYKLGEYCRSRRNYEEAIIWFHKSAEQGNTDAKFALVAMNPKRFKLSDVILCAICGERNLKTGTMLNVEFGLIDIFVHERSLVNEKILLEYGASDVQIVPIYFTHTALRPVKLRDIFNTSLSFNGDQVEETVRDDLGEGCVHITFTKISAEMANDFYKEILPRCSEMGIQRSLFDLQESMKNLQDLFD